MKTSNGLITASLAALLSLSLPMSALADPYQDGMNNKTEAQQQLYNEGVEAGEEDRLNGEPGAECYGGPIPDIFFQYGYREGFLATTPDYDKLACITEPEHRSAGNESNTQDDLLSPASARPVEVYTDEAVTRAPDYDSGSSPNTELSTPLRTVMSVAFETYRRTNGLGADYYPDGQIAEFSERDQRLFTMTDIQQDSLTPSRRPASVKQAAQAPDLNQLTTEELTLRAGLLLAKAGDFCEMGFEEPRLVDTLQNTVDVDEDLANLLSWDGSWDDLCRQRSRLLKR